VCYNNNMDKETTPTLKYRVSIVEHGAYRCIKVTVDPIAAVKAYDTYERLGHLAQIKARPIGETRGGSVVKREALLRGGA
jgi:hypothetical protein